MTTQPQGGQAAPFSRIGAAGMSGSNETDERALLRSIRRRNLAKALLAGGPALVLWWLTAGWIQRRCHVQRAPAELGALLAVLVVMHPVLKLLGRERFRDSRETPRIRWLQNEWSERITARTRLFWIISVSIVLLIRVLMLPLSGGGLGPADGWVLAFLLMSSGGLVVSRLPTVAAEFERAQRLAATHRAYLVTALLCAAALLLDPYWPGRLSGMIWIALLAGILTQQTSLALSDSGAGSRDG